MGGDPNRYKKHLQAVYVVHPTSWLRMRIWMWRMALGGSVSSKFWAKVLTTRVHGMRSSSCTLPYLIACMGDGSPLRICLVSASS